jgi:hypothetical protein
MRKILSLLTILSLSVTTSGQELTVSLDYKVVYKIPSPAKNTIDTVGIHFDKRGKFLYSENAMLGEDFGRSVFKNPNLDLSSANSNFIVDTEKMDVYFHFSLDQNFMFFKMNLETLLPVKADPFEGDVEIIAEATKDRIEIAGKRYPSYLLYTNTEPDDPITLIIDPSRPVNNFNVMDEFIQLMLRKTNSSGSMSLNIPDGLILGIYTKSGTLMEAISVEDISTKIKFVNRFNIDE